MAYFKDGRRRKGPFSVCQRTSLLKENVCGIAPGEFQMNYHNEVASLWKEVTVKQRERS
jgi:hypothetical protein